MDGYVIKEVLLWFEEFGNVKFIFNFVICNLCFFLFLMIFIFFWF